MFFLFLSPKSENLGKKNPEKTQKMAELKMLSYTNHVTVKLTDKPNSMILLS